MTFQHWSVWFDAKLYLVQREDEARVSKNLKKGKDEEQRRQNYYHLCHFKKVFELALFQ